MLGLMEFMTILLNALGHLHKSMCECRVCRIELMYPKNINKIIEDVFKYMMESK